MKNQKLIISGAIGVAIILVAVQIMSKQPKEKNEVGAVLIGSPEHQKTFNEAVKGGREFYDLYGKARKSLIAGNYEQTIELLKESESYIGIGLERGMVYDQLIEVYRDLGDLKNELVYLKLAPKYSMNDEEKQRWSQRAAEIERIMANPGMTDSGAERYPEPPIYGRKFKSHREVLIASQKSDDLWREAGVLYRDGHYEEAIKKLKMAYAPNSTQNAFVESSLIDCYEKIGDYQSALILLDYTLKNGNWGAETKERLERQKAKLLKLQN